MIAVAVAASLLWLLILIAPWRPWSTRERIEPLPRPSAVTSAATGGLAVTVMIPARNEAYSIEVVLDALENQAPIQRIIVVDDQSSDDTAAIAASFSGVEVIDGQPTPPGWSGKLWALQQGLVCVDTPLVLLLDADIKLAPGMVAAMIDKLRDEGLDQVSIMATLPTGYWPEKLMLPAFVYFFKQLYPFAWVNRPDRSVAAAAGGCVLVKRDVLERVGAFAAWKQCLIDDCELARRVRCADGKIWLGLSHGVNSLRRHPDLESVLETIRRTAFVQLRRSLVLLGLTVLLMLLMFAGPWLALLVAVWLQSLPLFMLGATGIALMTASYLPQVRFSGLRSWWALALSPAALLFLLATVDSARLTFLGRGAGWKGRRYGIDTRSSKR